MNQFDQSLLQYLIKKELEKNQDPEKLFSLISEAMNGQLQNFVRYAKGYDCGQR